jgi:hypothetical protein
MKIKSKPTFKLIKPERVAIREAHEKKNDGVKCERLAISEAHEKENKK